MNQIGKQADRLIWLGLGMTAALLVLAFMLAAFKARAFLGRPLPVYGQVAPFTLTNQFAQTVALSDLTGHVWVADVIFTRCAGPCLGMTRQMKEVQQGLPASSTARLVSLTTDPEFDTPAVLKTYGERFGADPNRWMFLTGPRQNIARIATDSLKLTAIEKKPEERTSPQDLFIHSTVFVVVDKHGQLRGVFETSGEGTNPQQTKAQILAAVRRLEREE